MQLFRLPYSDYTATTRLFHLSRNLNMLDTILLAAWSLKYTFNDRVARLWLDKYLAFKLKQ